MNHSFWQHKKVFVTGHTGFKGSWLCLWLRKLGAEVHGYSDSLPTSPSMYRLCGLETDIPWTRGDIRDCPKLIAALREVKPDLVFHLAAQPLVGASYKDPFTTFAVNVIGTAALLEAVRVTSVEHPVRAVVVATSDKCYANLESAKGFHEQDLLGGYDPYSASKASAELVVSAYRSSFFTGGDGIMPAVATVRAGNVIGGGDWAEGRIVPDCLRAAMLGHAPVLRRPGAIRPWQHVLEPLAGYLELAERLFTRGAAYAEAWNFGPREEDARTVAWLAETLCAALGTQSPVHAASLMEQPARGQRDDTTMLQLNIAKTQYRLHWWPRWEAAEAVERTAHWYRHWMKGSPMREISAAQIVDYEALDLSTQASHADNDSTTAAAVQHRRSSKL
ncbi:CDP-glucose 4,6-dehydratase [Paenibacillus baekrokdamisoli]|uniref:CDP-glucose 4,6-dehydratase n=1 Tax=Paenibacillus baekrokdamisoli TaxID=1712516 RepID=A0A3G9J5C5_9BACL|nr:CDP-glucose 4,6-dehydratase [Paenibacillus baekrokdamisoli]MBB3069706.1 CDP-glucose 4,6-dehydratase [Paenibacillus baekrokdamisoli]BBH20941.1 CDP-glucose 4,6-dehydratase [Paenibacillus baekrokdamisoli]